MSGRKKARRKGAGPTGLRYNIAILGSEIEQRLSWFPHLIAWISGVVVAVLLAPTVDKAHPPTELATIFGPIVGVAAVLFVTTIFVQRNPGNDRALRLLGIPTFLYLGLAVVAALAGLLPSLPYESYRCLLGCAIGGTLGGAATLLLVGVVNLWDQRKGAEEDKVKELSG
jgi:hypothetical protein